jgi:hypothetical protein
MAIKKTKNDCGCGKPVKITDRTNKNINNRVVIKRTKQ